MKLRWAAVAMMLAAGCSGGGSSQPTYADTEPNDTDATAIFVGDGGTHSVTGTCEQGGLDIYVANASQGTVEARITASNGSGQILMELEEGPPFLSTIGSVVSVGSGQTRTAAGDIADSASVYLRLHCPSGSSLDYSGTFRVP